MKPEFEQALRDLAIELDQEEPDKERIATLRRTLMSGRPRGNRQLAPDLTAQPEIASVRRVLMSEESSYNSQATPELTIAEQISNRRKQRGITQADLAFRAGVDRSTISRIEKGRQPTLSVLGKLVIPLELRPEDTFNLLIVASGRSRQQT